MRGMAMKLTFEHFCDNPSWAAAAGYEFNIIDCLSFSAGQADIKNGVKDFLTGIPDIELRSALWELPLHILAVAFFLTWPLTFWLGGLYVYLKCLRNRWKYLNSENERVIVNLRNWYEDCDRRIRRG